MAINKNTVMKEAQKFAAKGLFDKAIAEWKKLLQESPNDANIFNTIGDLCMKKDARADACDSYKKAADSLALDGFTSKAIALYKKVLNIDPKRIEVHLALGDLNAEKGLSGNALESYKIVADYYLQRKEMIKALAIYQKMADLNATNVSFRIKLGDMYAKENMISEASKAYLCAADVHLEKKEFKDARQLFEKVLSVDPGNMTVYHKAGIVYFEEGKFSEACKALKRAFENDPSNKEVADRYLDSLSKAGKEPEAEQVIRKLLEDDPARTDQREKLVSLYLAKNEQNKALDEVVTLAEAKTAAGDSNAAEMILKKFVADAPEYIPGRKQLGDLYRSLGRAQAAAAIYLQAAELLLETGDQGGAKTFLTLAVELSPDLEEAREHLDRLEATSHAVPPPEPAFEQMSPPSELEPAYEEPAPTPAAEPSALEESPAITEAFAEIDVLVKYGLTAKALEQLEMLAAKFPDSLLVHMRLQDLYRDQGNVSKAVEHALVLADLYSRNNLTDQSESVLNTALSIDPTNAALLAKLGKAPVPSEAFPTNTGQIAAKELALETPAPAEPFLFSSEPPEVPSPELPPTTKETPDFDLPPPLDEIAFEGLDAGMPPLEEEEPGVTEELNAGTSLPQEQWTAAAEELDAEIFPLDEEPVAVEGLDAETAPLQDEPAAAEELDAEISPLDEEPVAVEGLDAETAPLQDEPAAAELGSFGEPSTIGIREEPVAEVRTPPDTDQQQLADVPPDTGEIWAEAEFYFQQGLFDEAKKHYARIVQLNPGERRAIERLAELSREEEQSLEFSKLADAVEELESAADTEAEGQELPLSISDEDAVRSLMQEISQLNKQEKPATPPNPPTGEEPLSPRQFKQSADKKAGAPVTPAAVDAGAVERPSAPDEDFFDLGEELARESKRGPALASEQASEDFFDLAAELRDELSAVAVPERAAGSSEEQSLDEIFEDFKRGVEQQSVKEDVDTHYNLGVAYKEMGLLDDAITEFILTHKEEPKFIQSRYMLGLCYMEKGEYQNATVEIQNALHFAESLREGGQDTLGMHYDLGLAYQGAGNLNNAISEFQIVHALDPGYRDTSTKLKELQQGDFISLDQLKDDIEREISSKFLKEGERIEREERNRKNEKVRN
jgi:tetratricopeptide (TPR) repeat protein